MSIPFFILTRDAGDVFPPTAFPLVGMTGMRYFSDRNPSLSPVTFTRRALSVYYHADA